MKRLNVSIGEGIGVLLIMIWFSIAAAGAVIATGLVEVEGPAGLPLQVLTALAVFTAAIVATIAIVSLPVRHFVRPGVHRLDGAVFLWFGFYHGLFAVADQLFLRLIRGTFLMRAFYRMLGARIGSGTIINTNQISDAHLVEIGDDTIIGAYAVLNPHSGEGGRLHIARIRIGDRVTVGQYAVILSGSVIEDDVTVGASSLVPKNSRLRRGGFYGGVPTQEISRG
jgi:acetyltransferase-like isoleucine patch superfamily enzyme